MKTIGLRAAALALACGVAAVAADAEAEDGARKLLPVAAPAHDPLYIDAGSIRRSGALVAFKYVLDVPTPPQSGAPREWRSNEIEASIDCRARTVRVNRLTTYSGPRASGAATAVHTFSAAGLQPEPIAAKSTFAYLEAEVCRGG